MEQLSRKPSTVRRKINLISSTNFYSKVLEQYRSIRTNFLSFTKGQDYRSLLISSPNSDEGKSTIAANFAISLSQQGKKVLLIDADLRKPTLHLSFKTDNTFGLCDVLRGNISLNDSISKTDISDLDLLSSGSIPFNSSELLSSHEMSKLIERAIEIYDVTIIDAPALLEVADAKILAGQCDGSILVLKWGKTKSDEALEAKKSLESANAKVLGVILNEKD
ncbi:CpsD/CapB family tyrosine-protein kinase [Bacillus sp. DNRA2]|uniref:CpsD/CapB family tyrosine-protein kinase n=1 Tax=Bacillus sp. DNRA2 TaxID=2723053 RepID=UPI00145CDA5E|nr:CpsD/CapB family tyrosine-protein kinase [Bacillus sp. DNRA2]NMD70866.1 CpsD/CapB family tyrosine-protein kinase [Bacillus sp. DNRA2]